MNTTDEEPVSAPPTRLLSTAQVMDLMQFGRTKLYELTDAGEFPQPLRIGRHLRWRADELQAWIEGLPAGRHVGAA